MADLIQVRSKNRAPYWISRGLYERYPDDYERVGEKKPAKTRAKSPKAVSNPAPVTDTPATPAE